MARSQRGAVSIGIAGALGPRPAAEIALAAQRAGFRSLWVNDTPGADSLEVLSKAAEETDTLRLATGVIPVDRRGARGIVDDIKKRDLPEDRLVLGIGSGAARRGSLALVEESVRILRAETAATVVVGALGPRMRQLAAESAHGALLSWLTPRRAAEQAQQLREAAAEGENDGEPRGYAVLYARTAVEHAALARRDDETARYAAAGNYATNFARLEMDPQQTILPLPGDDSIRPGVEAYTASVDELVLRAMTPDDEAEDYLRFIELAREAIAEEAS